MRAVAIVQARMGSTRLPGKVLEDVRGRSVLAHVLERCAAIDGIDAVCCATSLLPEDDRIASEARGSRATVFRGDEADVLGRYHEAARAAAADVILRVTSDCPLIDPEICAAVLELRAREGADIAANNFEPTWPHGLDCEAVTGSALALANRLASAPYDREHVTPWLRRSSRVRRANLRGPGGALVEQRWTVDYPEDLAFVRAVVERLPSEGGSGWRAVAAVLDEHPAVADLNRGRRESAGSRTRIAAGDGATSAPALD